MMAPEVGTCPTGRHATVTPLTGHATADQRRAALCELADFIRVEDDTVRGDKPLSPVVDLIVPPLASWLCKNPVAAFNALVEAKAEFSAFVADEREWATAHDCGTSEETLAGLYARLLRDVDACADALMGVRS